MSFGGIAYRGEGFLPKVADLVWLVPDEGSLDAKSERSDILTFSRTGLPFIDLLASSNVVITKVGYGSFVEATAHNVPVLFLDRPDWPETPYLTAWLFQYGNAAVIDAATLFSSQVEICLKYLWQQPRKPGISTDGARDAALILMTEFAKNCWAS
jgi:UDP-N-acetylglucosamine:LPS N-acetylglucosamine transferase